MDIREICFFSDRIQELEAPVERFGRRLVAVIGIDRYPGMVLERLRINPLETAVHDARAVQETLEAEYGFEPLIEPLLDEKATYQGGFKQLFRSLRDETRIRPEDQVLIYFAGHGIEHSSGSEGFWIPFMENPEDYADYNEYITHSRIQRNLLDCPARQVLLVSDSCYAQKLTEKARYVNPDSVPDLNQRLLELACQVQVRSVLTSGSREPVLDRGGGGHSLFCNHFLDLLRKYPGTCLPIGDVSYSLLRQGVEASAKRLGHKQSPRLGYLTDDTVPFLLFKDQPRKTKAKTSKPLPSVEIAEEVLTGEVEVICSKVGLEIVLGDVARFSSKQGVKQRVRNVPVGRYEVRALDQGQTVWQGRVEVRDDRSSLVRIEVKIGPEPKDTDRDGRFIAYADGTVMDTSTGLMWAAKDNGQDITWDDAKTYCKGFKGGGYSDWRMPTIEDLKSLYDPGAGNKHNQATSLIVLTRWDVWSNETPDGSSAAVFNFGSGERDVFDRSIVIIESRALPVRAGT